MNATTSTGAEHLTDYINLKLALLGFAPVVTQGRPVFEELAAPLIAQDREKDRLLGDHLCPADQRIQAFLFDYLQEIPVPRLPLRTLVLDRPGLACALSLPPGSDSFHSGILASYRVKQGVLHNPSSDRRTTKGVFHVAEGGLPIPADKISVPKAVFARLFAEALEPPRELLRLPFTDGQPHPADCFTSLLLRPLICPEVPGYGNKRTMELRFFAPGSLVSNLDFVERIFGNAGDPNLPENDAGLDTEHWTGHTGCVILAPHLTKLAKKDLGLPALEHATERQRRDGMCWHTEDELYNDGKSFKITCRDETGVIVTLIADNYFGYCKKEVKTMISFAANLFGSCEEEHSGGAMVFPSYDLGEDYSGELHVKGHGHSFAEVSTRYSDWLELQPEGYAVDRRHRDIIYVPEGARFDLRNQRITWPGESSGKGIKLMAGRTYVRPSGYKVRMVKPPDNRAWRMVGTVAEGLLCHKPCTVSGGGKSEISKPLSDAVLAGPVFVADFQKDFDQVARLAAHDYSRRFRDPSHVDLRPILSAERSLGSVIKLLTPDERDYTPEYNEWLGTLPQHLKELVFVVKRFYKPEWGDHWRDHFSVDIQDGKPANELKFHNRKLIATYLRVGFSTDGSWRVFGLRSDFFPAVKIQVEDDITASVVVPARTLPGSSDSCSEASLKFVKNAEQRLFQRPDDAIHRGYDKQTESDFAEPGNFFSNYEPLTAEHAEEMVEDAIGFYQFTAQMQAVISEVAKAKTGLFVSPSNPRLVEGKPSKNPRYLQKRPDLVSSRETYLAEMSTRLSRRLLPDQPVMNPVTAMLPGRRNNPPEGAIRSLAVYNPIHYFELPELFMEFICSMTGKSPSTTGAGSEGALTKGPFNALPPIIDLNNALVSWILTGHQAFITSAGYVGPHFRVDHDISLLVPEVWCRMGPQERQPQFLIKNNYLDKCEDFEFHSNRVLGSRLGYRINARFVHAFFGRVFNHPHAVFTDEMLKPELQDPEVFADGIENIVSTQQRVAQLYFEDGSIHQACPPLRALLHVMRNNAWEGKSLAHSELRQLFTRESLLASDWYVARLKAKQEVDCQLWRRHANYLTRFLKRTTYAEEARRLGIDQRLSNAKAKLSQALSSSYLESLQGTIGAEPVRNHLPPSNQAPRQSVDPNQK
jgi:hypothetical protein